MYDIFYCLAAGFMIWYLSRPN